MSPPEQIHRLEKRTETATEKVVASEVKKETTQVQKEVIDNKLLNIKEKQDLFDGAKNKMTGLISGTSFEKQFQDHQAELESKIPGFTLEKFSWDISQSVGEYLWQTLFDKTKQKTKLSPEVMVSLSVGIQWAMLETLKASGSSGAEFFTDFASLGFDGAGNAFEWLFKTFGNVSQKAGNVNYFYKLGNRIQNCVGYLSSQAGKPWMKDGSWYKELMVPNEFRKLVNSEIWDTAENYQKKTPQELWFTSVTYTDLANGDESFKKDVLTDTQLDVWTIAAISKALPKSMQFLNKRAWYKTQTNELMDTVGKGLSFDIAGLGTLWSLLGISSPAKLLWKSKLANFVLKAMGFDGVEGLHREYIRNNIDKQLTSPEQKLLIKETLLAFKKDVPDSTKDSDILALSKLTTLDQATKNKLPKKKDVMVQSLMAWITGRELNLSLKAYRSLGIHVSTTKDAEGREVVDTKTSVTISQAAIEKYIVKETSLLAKNKLFMKEIQTPDQFMLAMAGNLVADQFFVEGVCLWLETPLDYGVETSDQTSNARELSPEKKQELQQNIQKELEKMANCPLTPSMVLASSQKYTVPIEYILAIMKNDSSYGTAWLWARTHNPGNVGNTDNGWTKDWWTWEAWVDAVAQNLRYRMDGYTKIYTKDSLSLKYLADNVGPDGKWFLPDQANYKQLNTEKKGAYMSAPTGSDQVKKFSEDLAKAGITNKEETLLA